MILEGIITTEASDGGMHVSPIGPHVNRELTHWELKPFKTSHTFGNLRRTQRGVFHIVDDGLLMVQAVLGLCNPPHQQPVAEYNDSFGWILQGACHAIPLQVVSWDVEQDRATARCAAGPCLYDRTFWGWNRANHSLLELAILWSRKHMIDATLLQSELERHRIIILKTAGDRELEALRLLESALIQ
jgi:hypothetical protein